MLSATLGAPLLQSDEADAEVCAINEQHVLQLREHGNIHSAAVQQHSTSNGITYSSPRTPGRTISPILIIHHTTPPLSHSLSQQHLPTLALPPSAITGEQRVRGHSFSHSSHSTSNGNTAHNAPAVQHSSHAISTYAVTQSISVTPYSATLTTTERSTVAEVRPQSKLDISSTFYPSLGSSDYIHSIAARILFTPWFHGSFLAVIVLLFLLLLAHAFMKCCAEDFLLHFCSNYNYSTLFIVYSSIDLLVTLLLVAEVILRLLATQHHLFDSPETISYLLILLAATAMNITKDYAHVHFDNNNSKVAWIAIRYACFILRLCIACHIARTHHKLYNNATSAVLLDSDVTYGELVLSDHNSARSSPTATQRSDGFLDEAGDDSDSDTGLLTTKSPAYDNTSYVPIPGPDYAVTVQPTHSHVHPITRLLSDNIQNPSPSNIN